MKRTGQTAPRIVPTLHLYRDGVPSFVRDRTAAVEPATNPAAPTHEPAPAPPDENRFGGNVPKSGRALFAWAKEQEQRCAVGLLKYLNSWAKLQDFPHRMVDWSAEQVSAGYAEACRKLQSVPASQAEAYEEALAN
jgi:hypothetical protein